MKYTAIKHEKHLNELYSDCYSQQEAIDQFCYLNGGKIKASTIAKYHTNHELGTLVRKHDPIGFRVGLNERRIKR